MSLASCPRTRSTSGLNVRQGDVANLDIVVPLVEQLDVANLLGDVLGKDAGENVDITALRHFEYSSRWFRGWRGTAVSMLGLS